METCRLSFEAALLMQSFAAPLAFSSVLAWMLVPCIRSISMSTLAKQILVGHAWWLSAVVVLAISARSLQFEENWQQAVYWLWLPVLVVCIASKHVKPLTLWILMSLSVAIFLGASLPMGDGWQDMETTKHVGWLVGGVAWLLNALLSNDRCSNILSRGSFVWTLFVHQVSLAICALSCYGSLGAWALGLTALVVSFATLVSTSESGIARTVVWPAYAAAAMVAITAVLYGANPLPVLVALFVPSLVGIVDRVCRLLSFSQAHQSWVALILSTVMLTIVIVLVSLS